MAAKQPTTVPGVKYEAVRFWRRTDPRTGADTNYSPGDPYSGPLDSPYLLDPKGPDGQGALIAEISATNAEASTPVSSSDSSDKENS